MTEDRFSSISGLLNPRPQRTEATIHRITPQPDQPTTPTEPPPTRSSTNAPKSRQAAGGNRRVVFKLAPDLHARLTAHAKSTGESYGNTVLDAVEVAHTANALTGLLADPQHEGSASGGGEGMFARVAQRGNAAPAVTVEIQLRAQAVEQLDRLVDHYQAASRTRLLTAALRYHLR